MDAIAAIVAAVAVVDAIAVVATAVAATAVAGAGLPTAAVAPTVVVGAGLPTAAVDSTAVARPIAVAGTNPGAVADTIDDHNHHHNDVGACRKVRRRQELRLLEIQLCFLLRPSHCIELAAENYRHRNAGTCCIHCRTYYSHCRNRIPDHNNHVWDGSNRCSVDVHRKFHRRFRSELVRKHEILRRYHNSVRSHDAADNCDVAVDGVLADDALAALDGSHYNTRYAPLKVHGTSFPGDDEFALLDLSP